ncbi:hypothetical protein PA7_38510 [Pseudonocardia asaccharolytica DSM 44247 = NBRC 16224]|uniref:Uncharacterized protein n=1 Tax=Pseudonocardia asaccharolytica DSM 44247 = NBRC 16224 TaxID=1123024 RepID=A0A511D8M9_9PSEU|nr:hypothetical protein PA7_38510 [Pseudonocardia asaccharolytica DSM 44247 = NBRC 16224]
MSLRTCLRSLGRGILQGLGSDNGWCWAACTLGTFPVGMALAAHRGYRHTDRIGRPGLDERGVRPVPQRTRRLAPRPGPLVDPVRTVHAGAAAGPTPQRCPAVIVAGGEPGAARV